MIVCGSGHRPQHLPCGFIESHLWKRTVCNDLKDWLKKNNPSKIITGMALGWDTWLAEAAIELQIPFEAFVPFIYQERKWPAEAQIKYHSILEKASQVYIISEGEYATWKMHRRNQVMINESDALLLLYSSTKLSGGTYSCYKLALKKNMPIHNFYLDPQTYLN